VGQASELGGRPGLPKAERENRMPSRYYRTETTENAVDALAQSVRFYKSHLKHKWKWFVICLHDALYSFSICAIKGTNPDRVMRGQNLVSAREALIRCQSDAYMQQYVHSTTLEMTEHEKEMVGELLVWVRDNLAHFSPKLWSIEIAWIKRVVKPTVRVIRFLALESGNVRMTAAQRNRVIRALAAL
jgi:hypothetical protein